MKQAIFFLTFSIVQQAAMAQSPAVRQVYAWAQPVLSGVRPAIQTVDGGGDIQPKDSKVNYFIYAEPAVKTEVIWCGIWMRSGYFQVKTDSVPAIPAIVLEEQENGVRMVRDLVPENAGPVIQLTPGDQRKVRVKNPAWLNRLLKDNELIIVYIYKGKTWYHPVSKIKMLDAVPGS